MEVCIIWMGISNYSIGFSAAKSNWQLAVRPTINAKLHGPQYDGSVLPDAITNDDGPEHVDAIWRWLPIQLYITHLINTLINYRLPLKLLHAVLREHVL